MLLPVNYSISIKAIGNTGKKTTARTGFFGVPSVTRMDEIYFSPLNQYGPFRKGTRKQVTNLVLVSIRVAPLGYLQLHQPNCIANQQTSP